MRSIWLTIAVLLVSTSAARAERSGVLRTLSQAEIDARLKPVSAEISRCYHEATGGAHGGKLVVELGIHRRGSLDTVAVQTPGLPAKLARKVEACVRDIVEPLEFPARRTSTSAVIPFLFHRAEAPGAGPQLSCWSPRGCPGR